ncbi:acyltransferase family protein (macronuclear) [Tetrahymena thermophila SB210]|uniref:Acyltransferase family protein n=1 Tax=Tetrahymena thermophila (strain SB210) TaxID=312017 RepID=Q24CF0_TETTS|nr:acyltransferase family protein [Tetrahymena thermophila SB210]EAS05424.2 acyltransferase family protein [Tetrahymena thermophila SB210]|eukprot:XP_001025669.2 acyltransferase family protein [Tetrahymena thermophila SB210]
MKLNRYFQVLALLCAASFVCCNNLGANSQLLACQNSIQQILTDTKSFLSQVCTGSTSAGFNNLGDRDRCLNATGTNFISVYLNNNFQNVYPAPYVLCLPDDCTSTIINENKSQFNLLLNTLISKATKQQTNFQVTNAYDAQNDTPSVDAGVVIVSIIIAFICIASILGSIIVYRYESSKEKAIKMRLQQQLNEEVPSAALSNDINEDYPLPQESRLVKIGRAFGIVENFNKLFTFKNQGHIDFAIINGTRVFCIVWIIIGQSYLIRFGSVKNIYDKGDIQSSAGYSTIAATSQLAVDMFFYISGFLLAAIFLERFANRTELKPTTLLLFIAHRFIRLWPTYFIVLLFYWQIWQYTGNGPMFNQEIDNINNCDSRIWANLLMIDNLANNGDTQGCFQWGFVISNEIQFFIVGLILLYIYSMNSKIGIGMILSFFIGSQVAATVIASNNDYKADYFTLTNPDTFYNDFHIKPWVRMGPYFLGVLAGIYYRSYKTGTSSVVQFADKVLNNSILRYVLYFVGLSLISSMVWCIIPVQKDIENWSQAGHSIYLAFGRIGFILGYFLMTIPLMFGKRNYLRALLGARIWVPLSRVTFCMYLVHQFVIERSLLNQKSIRYFDNQLALYAAISDIVFVLLFAAAFCVCVELPIINLEKLFLITPSKLKGIQGEENDDFEAIEIKKQMMAQ